MHNGYELSGAAQLLHLIFELRLRPLQRIVMRRRIVSAMGTQITLEEIRNNRKTPIDNKECKGKRRPKSANRRWDAI